MASEKTDVLVADWLVSVEDRLAATAGKVSCHVVSRGDGERFALSWERVGRGWRLLICHGTLRKAIRQCSGKELRRARRLVSPLLRTMLDLMERDLATIDEALAAVDLTGLKGGNRA